MAGWTVVPNGDTSAWKPVKAAPAPPQGNGLQRFVDNLTTVTPEQDANTPALLKPLAHFGAGAIQGATSPFVHPFQAIKGMADQVNATLSGNPFQMADALHVPDLVKAFQEHPAEAVESTAGNLIGGAALGEGIGASGGALSRAMAGPMERGGLNLGNAALGARGPKPFKYGADPARGAFEEGVLPAMSKHSASLKLEKALPGAGQRISDAVMQGGTAPLNDIANSIEGPANEARSIIQGPGGGNRSVDPIDALVNSMRNKAPGAARPIYGPDAGTPFTSQQAAAAINRPQPLMLPAPMTDTMLHSTPDIEGELSRPVTLNQVDRPMRRALPVPRNVESETPLVETPGRDPEMSPMAFPADKFPQRNISGFGTDSGEAGNLGRNFRELGSTTRTIPARLTREAYMSGSEHPELSGQIPVSQGILRRFETPQAGEATGMGPGQYVGEVPGDRGGMGQPQGVLRRTMDFPESDEPSPLSDLRHPHATAPDVWRTIQNVDKNTRFNPDPEVEGVNELRRDMRGGLRGNLEDAVPGLKPLSQRYGDLKSAEEVLDRSMHGGTSLRKMVSVPTFPIESAVGRAMYGTGKAMAHPEVFENAAPAMGVVQALRNEKKKE